MKRMILLVALLPSCSLYVSGQDERINRLEASVVELRAGKADVAAVGEAFKSVGQQLTAINQKLDAHAPSAGVADGQTKKP